MTTRAVQIAELGNTSFLELDSNGNLGLGTSSPTTLLHIQQTVDGSGGGLQVRNSTDSSGIFMYVDGSNHGQIDMGTLGDLQFRTGGTDRIMIKQTGNVGIGTTNPAGLLDVNGTSYFRSSMNVDGNIYFDASGKNIWIDSDGTRDTLFWTRSGVQRWALTHDASDHILDFQWRGANPANSDEIRINGNRILTTNDGNLTRNAYTATAGQTSFSATYTTGQVDVFLNGIKLTRTTDYTDTSGTAIVLTSAAELNDQVEIISYGTYTIPGALPLSGGTLSGNLSVNGTLDVSSTSNFNGAVNFNHHMNFDSNGFQFLIDSDGQRDNIYWTRNGTSHHHIEHLTNGDLNIINDIAAKLLLNGSEVVNAAGSVQFTENINVAAGKAIDFNTSQGVKFGTGYNNGGLTGQSAYTGFVSSTGKLIFGVGPDQIIWGPVENGVDEVRNLVSFDYTNNGSYPIFTNRTPAGKLAIATAPDAGGGDNIRLMFNGGSGTGPLNEVDIEVRNANFKSGGHYIYKHHNCTQIGSGVGSASTSTSADCGACVDTNGGMNGCSQGTGTAYNWFNAKKYCEKAGMRLCTLQEHIDRAAEGTGCSHDNRVIWSSTMNSSGQYFIAHGNNGSSNTARYPSDGSAPGTTLGNTIDEFGIRCCGQNDWG